MKSSRNSSQETNDLVAYLRSGNNIPVTRATIPWPGIGMVTVDALWDRTKRTVQRDKKDVV